MEFILDDKTVYSIPVSRLPRHDHKFSRPISAMDCGAVTIDRRRPPPSSSPTPKVHRSFRPRRGKEGGHEPSTSVDNKTYVLETG